MDKAEVELEVKKMVAFQYGCSLDEVDMTTNFIADLQADSLDFVEGVMAMEDRFNIDIKDEEAEALLTVSSVVDFVVRKLNESK
jgi:acyl carrier protein